MNDQDQKTADQVVAVVADAVTATAPLAGALAPVVVMVVSGVRALISFAEQLGHGDAVREALDAELAVGRQATDAAIDSKFGHRKTDPPT